MGYAWRVRERAEVEYGAAAISDADRLDDLADEIATLAAHIHAATHRLLVLIARSDGLRGWEPSGHRDCAAWLSARTGIDRGAAVEKVRAARALETLPETSRAMARGELSFSQVRALTRVATADNEGELLELAREAPTAQLERMVRAWRRGSRQDEAERERERHRSRTLSVFPDDEGMYVIRGRLTPEVGALLMRAIEAAADQLFRGDGPYPDPVESREAAGRRRADAIGLLAEQALAAGPTSSDDPASPVSGTRPERYQVVLHVEPATLAAEGEPGRSELEDGTRLSAESARRIACDASVVEVRYDTRGSILDVGRKTRTVSPALRRALEIRDRGCRFPCCGLRFTEAHHVTHWAEGGGTSLANCLLLCRHHHDLVHEGGWRVEWWGAERVPVFIDSRGGTHADFRSKAPRLPPDPVRALERDNALHGAAPDAWTAAPRRGRAADVREDAVLGAAEAMELGLPKSRASGAPSAPSS